MTSITEIILLFRIRTRIRTDSKTGEFLYVSYSTEFSSSSGPRVLQIQS